LFVITQSPLNRIKILLSAYAVFPLFKNDAVETVAPNERIKEKPLVGQISLCELLSEIRLACYICCGGLCEMMTLICAPFRTNFLKIVYEFI